MFNDLKGLFLEELNDIYDAENQIVQALPNVINAVESKELKDALVQHLGETKNQVTRLNEIFKKAQVQPGAVSCQAMKGLIAECDEIISKIPSSPLRDAALISKAQRIEHYEIATYGTLRTFADQLDWDFAVDLLQDTLDEEANADKALTKIAEGGFFTSGVNQQAKRR